MPMATVCSRRCGGSLGATASRGWVRSAGHLYVWRTRQETADAPEPLVSPAARLTAYAHPKQGPAASGALFRIVELFCSME